TGSVLDGCLQKDRRQRCADISVPIFLPNQSRAVTTPQTASAAAAQPLWRRALPLAGAVVATAAVTGAVMWSFRPSAATPIVTRFSFPLGEGQQFTNTGRRLVAISPDGTRLAY